MNKCNTNHLQETPLLTATGDLRAAGKDVSEALGRIPASTDSRERHPFDVEILRIPAGATPYPYHAHSAQWEFYHVVAGSGQVRDAGGLTAVETGDAFVFKPGEAHQLINDSAADFVLYVIADNPHGEFVYLPDTTEWSVSLPERRRIGGA